MYRVNEIKRSQRRITGQLLRMYRVQQYDGYSQQTLCVDFLY